MSSRLRVLDSCSFLNLVASRRFEEIAAIGSTGFVIPHQVASEVRYVRRGSSGPDAREPEPIDLISLCSSGRLSIVDLEIPNEIDRHVELARLVDDGEAAACSVAITRGAILVTDDRLTRRIIGQRYPGLDLLTTSQVLKQWADYAIRDLDELARVLADVEERGNFRPGRRDPLLEWWERTLGRR